MRPLSFVQRNGRWRGGGRRLWVGTMPRRLLLSCLLVLLFVPSWSREPRLDLARIGPAAITARPVQLDPADSLRDRIGALRYLGGVQLFGPDRTFSGFSGLAVAEVGKGARILTVSDGGVLARFTLGRDWRISDGWMGNLPAGPGDGWEKRERDAEALAVEAGGGGQGSANFGRVWVAFERANALYRYDPTLTRAQASRRPRAMARWSPNSGPESLARDSRGNFVTFAEADFSDDGRGTAALWFRGDPAEVAPAFAFRLRPPRGWLPVDAAFLPGGDLLVLLRRFSLADRGFASRLMRVARADIRTGASVRGRTLATLARPLIHDNFEGLAVTRREGRTIVWLISDDNQGWPQRTLLLAFALEDAPTQKGPPRQREP